MYERAETFTTSPAQHCVAAPTTEAECVMMAKVAKKCTFVRAVLSFLRTRVVLGRVIKLWDCSFRGQHGDQGFGCKHPQF